MSGRWSVICWHATHVANILLKQSDVTFQWAIWSGIPQGTFESSLRKFYGRYRDFIKHYEVPLSRMVSDSLYPSHIHWQPSTDQNLNRDLITKLGLLPNYERFPGNICTGCDMPTGDAYSSGHLVPSLWDLHMFYLLRPILFPNLSLFFCTMHFKHSSVLSRFCLLFYISIYQQYLNWARVSDEDSSTYFFRQSSTSIFLFDSNHHISFESKWSRVKVKTST